MADSSNTRLDAAEAQKSTSSDHRTVGAAATDEAAEAQSAVAMQALIPASEIPGIADPADGLPTSAEPSGTLPAKNERVEAAAMAMECDLTPSTTWRRLAAVALTAADSLERPAVERLVAALRDVCESKMVNLNSTHRCVPSPIIERAIAVLAEFGQQPTGDD